MEGTVASLIKSQVHKLDISHYRVEKQLNRNDADYCKVNSDGSFNDTGGIGTPVIK